MNGTKARVPGRRHPQEAAAPRRCRKACACWGGRDPSLRARAPTSCSTPNGHLRLVPAARQQHDAGRGSSSSPAPMRSCSSAVGWPDKAAGTTSRCRWLDPAGNVPPRARPVPSASARRAASPAMPSPARGSRPQRHRHRDHAPRNTEGELLSSVGGVMFEGTPRELVLQEGPCSRATAPSGACCGHAFERRRAAGAEHVINGRDQSSAQTRSACPRWDARAPAGSPRQYPLDRHLGTSSTSMNPVRAASLIAAAALRRGGRRRDLFERHPSRTSGPRFAPGTIGPAPFGEPRSGSGASVAVRSRCSGSGARHIAGRGIANPVAMIWSAALMLEFLGQGTSGGRRAATRRPTTPSSRRSPTCSKGPHTRDPVARRVPWTWVERSRRGWSLHERRYGGSLVEAGGVARRSLPPVRLPAADVIPAAMAGRRYRAIGCVHHPGSLRDAFGPGRRLDRSCCPAYDIW